MDQTLICRTCNVAANCVITNSNIESAHCPNCGVNVEGTDSSRMIKELASYYAATEAQKAFRRAFQGSKNIKYKDTRIRQPSWPFILKS